MKIQIVGPGCPNCEATERNVFNACAKLDIAADISPMREAGSLPGIGTIATPAVVVDDRVIVSGRAPTVAELMSMLK